MANQSDFCSLFAMDIHKLCLSIYAYIWLPQIIGKQSFIPMPCELLCKFFFTDHTSKPICITSADPLWHLTEIDLDVYRGGQFLFGWSLRNRPLNVIFSGRSCKLSLSHLLIFLQCYNNKNNNYLVYSTFHFQSAFAVLINPYCEV